MRNNSISDGDPVAWVHGYAVPTYLIAGWPFTTATNHDNLVEHHIKPAPQLPRCDYCGIAEHGERGRCIACGAPK